MKKSNIIILGLLLGICLATGMLAFEAQRNSINNYEATNGTLPNLKGPPIHPMTFLTLTVILVGIAICVGALVKRPPLRSRLEVEDMENVKINLIGPEKIRKKAKEKDKKNYTMEVNDAE